MESPFNKRLGKNKIAITLFLNIRREGFHEDAIAYFDYVFRVFSS